MATVSQRPQKFLRPSKRKEVLVAELNQLFEKRDFPKSDGDSPTQSPVGGGKFPKKSRPLAKNRSESLTDLQKHQVNTKLTHTVSEGPRSFTQSLSLASSNAVVREGPSKAANRREDSFHSKSLPKTHIRSVVRPPPAKPPPKFKSSLEPSVEGEEMTAVTDKPKKRKKKKSPAQKFLKMLKKKQTHKVSEIPSNQVVISGVIMDTISPPCGSSKDYQNIFEFLERREFPSGRKTESFCRTPKKPMPLPRTSSMSNSSIHGLPYLRPSRPINQSDRKTPVAIAESLPLLSPGGGVARGNKTNTRQISVKQVDGRLVARRPTRRHKSTRREAKQLRNGVCSDSETKVFSSSDDDDYITMNPALAPMMLALPSPAHNLDPRASGYYLKILPPEYRVPHDRRAMSEEPVLYASSSDSDSTSEPENEHNQLLQAAAVDEPTFTRIRATTPTSPDYIHMESWLTDSGELDESAERETLCDWLSEPVAVGNQESQSLPVHLLSNTVGKSPQKVAPVIKETLAAAGSAGGRQIKYSDVTILPVEGVPRKPSKSQKIKYEQVDLKESGVKDEPRPLPVPERSPVSQPHSVTPPTEERIYYKTTSSLTGSRAPQPHAVTAPPLTGLVPVRRLDWHSYVEIDTDEAESSAPENEPIGSQTSGDELSSSQTSTDSSPYKLAPPTVPERPDDLDGWVQARVHNRQHLVLSGDYSYVKRGGVPVWLSSKQHRRLVELNACSPESPPVSGDQQAPPPSVPPKTASLLREVGLKPFHEGSPEPYLYPVFLKKRAHAPGQPNARVTLSKVARIKRKSNKSDLPPPVAPYKPKEGKFSLHDNTMMSSVRQACLDGASPSEFPPSKSPPPPPPKKTSRASLTPPPLTPPSAMEPGSPAKHDEVKILSSDAQLSPDKHLSPPPSLPTCSEERVTHSSLRRNSSNNNNFSPDIVCPSPSAEDSGTELSCECDLESHMDQESLAVLYHNKREIVRRLSRRKDSESSSKTDSRRENEADGMESMPAVRTLDEVVSELDMIVRQRLCSRADLIHAIESQLHIQISGGSKEEEDDEEPAADVSSRHHPYQNLQYLPEVEGKPRSGTVICYDSDSEDTPPPPPLPPPPHTMHSRTQSSPSLSRKLGKSNPRTLSTPLIKIDDHCHDNNQASYPSDNAAGYHENLSVSRGGNRCYSNGWNQSPLKRTNAKRRTSTTTCEEMGVVKSFTDGHGVFTHHGGQLTKMGSGVHVEVPEGAVAKGQKQSLWFDVVQTTIDPRENCDTKSRLLSELSSSLDATGDHMTDRKDRRIQLSPMVLIGPSDVTLNRPIKIKIPHCLSYLNNSWHLQVFGRPHDSSDDSWTEVTNTMGLVDLPNKKLKKDFKNSTSQLHLDYVTITTTELGYFKLMGRPIRNGVLSAKQMVGSVFSRGRECESDPLCLEVFITDALTDHERSLQHSLVTHGRQCLHRNMPVLCFGDGRDMEILISCQSRPLGTMVIPFGQFWRQKVIGQASAAFQIDPKLLGKSRTLTLKAQQAGSKYIHETNFLVP